MRRTAPLPLQHFRFHHVRFASPEGFKAKIRLKARWQNLCRRVAECVMLPFGLGLGVGGGELGVRGWWWLSGWEPMCKSGWVAEWLLQFLVPHCSSTCNWHFWLFLHGLHCPKCPGWERGRRKVNESGRWRGWKMGSRNACDVLCWFVQKNMNTWFAFYLVFCASYALPGSTRSDFSER